MHQRPPVEHAVVIRPEASGNSLGSSVEFLAEASFQKATHRPNQRTHFIEGSVVCGFGHRFHHAIEIEAAGLLTWREFLEALQPLPDIAGRWRDQEHAVCEPALESHGILIFGPLERIHAQVDDQRSPQGGEGFLPDLETFGVLLEKGDLPVVVPKRGHACRRPSNR